MPPLQVAFPEATAHAAALNGVMAILSLLDSKKNGHKSSGIFNSKK
jgi:hypothetical protein